MSDPLKISVELGHLLPAGVPFDKSIFPNLSFAVKTIAEEAQFQWRGYANGAPLPDGKTIANRTGEYARSIMLRQTGDFSAEVYSDIAYAAAIEYGMPQRDLKVMLNYSLKVRIAKDGRRYLIVPFRWNAPNSVLGHNMPKAVYNWWRSGTEFSLISGKYRRLSGTGALDIKTHRKITVPGWRYKWGTRLTEDDLDALGVKGNKLVKQMAGMVRFRQSPKGAKTQRGGYITFRVMAEGSKGWIAKAQPGKFPARSTAEQIRPIAEKAFAAAAEADIKAFFAGLADA